MSRAYLDSCKFGLQKAGNRIGLVCREAMSNQRAVEPSPLQHRKEMVIVEHAGACRREVAISEAILGVGKGNPISKQRHGAFNEHLLPLRTYNFEEICRIEDDPNSFIAEEVDQLASPLRGTDNICELRLYAEHHVIPFSNGKQKLELSAHLPPCVGA